MKLSLPTAALLLTVAVSRLVAAPFTFQATNLPPDLLLGFRQNGGAQELVVDLGPVWRFYAAAPGSKLTITGFTAAQFTNAFAGLDNVGFAVFGAVRTDGDPERPLQTVWATRKRTGPAVRSDPWNRVSSFSLANSATRISSIGSGTATFSSANPAGRDNTPTAVVLPASNPNGYSTYLGTGNLKNTFQGSLENVTPQNFASGTEGLRSDLYEVRPGSGESTYLGYFELTPAGAMTFTAAGGSTPVPPPAPTLTAITHDGGRSTVSFTTVTGAKYSLLGTGPTGILTPSSQWAVRAAAVVGTGEVMSIVDTAADTDAFYAVLAEP
jgi:hypothetical protein